MHRSFWLGSFSRGIMRCNKKEIRLTDSYGVARKLTIPRFAKILIHSIYSI